MYKTFCSQISIYQNCGTWGEQGADDFEKFSEATTGKPSDFG